MKRIPYERLVALDAELARLGKQAGALRWQLGAALELLAEKEWHHELGFSSLGAYVLERCERTTRWAADSRAVARRLAKLPGLRAALARGEVSWSMAELVSRFAMPDSEDALVERARRTTVRGMKALLKAEAAGDGPRPRQPKSGGGGAAEGEPGASAAEAGAPDVDGEEDAPDEFCTLTLTMDLADGWLLERTRILLERLSGMQSSDELVQAMAAEALTSLLEYTPVNVGNLSEDDDDEARRAAWYRQLKRWREEGEALCEENLADLLGLGGAVESVDADGTAAERVVERVSGLRAARELDCWIVGASQELARRDLRMGEIAEALHQADGWRRLRFASEAQYARERVGMCFSSLKERRALARAGQRFPELDQAVAAGKIGCEAARLVARVSSARTIAAWIDRSQVRTLRHLQEEVELGEMVKRLSGKPDCWPPSEEQMRDFARVEAAVVGGEASVGSAEVGASVEAGDGSAGGERECSDRKCPGDAGRSGSTGQGEGPGFQPPESQMSGGGSGESREAHGGPSCGAAGFWDGPPSVARGESNRRAEEATRREAERMRAQAAWQRATVRLRELLTVGWVGDVGGGSPGDRCGEQAQAGRPGDPACAASVCEEMERLVGELSSGARRRAACPSGFGAGPGVGRVRFSLRVRRTTVRFWRRLAAEARRVLPRGVSFVRFACFAVWAAWSHLLEQRVAYDHVYARDRQRCTCPLCGRRGVTPHHLLFRGRGGDDSDENVSSLCLWCHLSGVHENRLVAVPPASKILWVIGRDPWLVVYGREKMTPEEWARRSAAWPGPERSVG